jgi:ribosomal protein S27E
MSKYEVIVGNVGIVYTGDNRPKAFRIFHDYVAKSTERDGRAAYEPVTLLRDDRIIAELVAKDPPTVRSQSGYTNCACRDCFDVTISSDQNKPELCELCGEAMCDESGESACERIDADDGDWDGNQD